MESTAILAKCRAAHVDPLAAYPPALVDVGAPLLALGPAENRDDSRLAVGSGAGLNPYFLHLNRCRKRFKQSKPATYRLTADDQAAVVAEAQREWAVMPDAERQAFNDIYNARVNRRQHAPADVANTVVVPYTPALIGGTPECPIDPEHFRKAVIRISKANG
jgi:hypothetical protein